MLVHNIRKNESRIIDFRETAPSGLREDMLQDLQHKVNRMSQSKGDVTPHITFTESESKRSGYFCRGFILRIIK